MSLIFSSNSSWNSSWNLFHLSESLESQLVVPIFVEYLNQSSCCDLLMDLFDENWSSILLNLLFLCGYWLEPIFLTMLPLNLSVGFSSILIYGFAPVQKLIYSFGTMQKFIDGLRIIQKFIYYLTPIQKTLRHVSGLGTFTVQLSSHKVFNLFFIICIRINFPECFNGVCFD